MGRGGGERAEWGGGAKWGEGRREGGEVEGDG